VTSPYCRISGGDLITITARELIFQVSTTNIYMQTCGGGYCCYVWWKFY